MVSPYLTRPLRSLDEVLRARATRAQAAREAAMPRWREHPAKTLAAAPAPAPALAPAKALPALPPPHRFAA